MGSSIASLRRQVKELKQRVREAEERKGLKTQRKALRKQRGKRGRFADFVRREFEKHPGINLKQAAKLAKKAYREV